MKYLIKDDILIKLDIMFNAKDIGIENIDALFNKSKERSYSSSLKCIKEFSLINSSGREILEKNNHELLNFTKFTL